MSRHPEERSPLYRSLLRLLPRDFRERWGTDMEEAFAHRLRRAGRSRLRLAWVWGRAVVDLFMHTLLERLAHRKDAPHVVGGTMKMTGLWNDLRFALRGLLRAPGFTVITIGTLALGIGATTAIFSVVNGVLLKPLPFEHPDELVSVWNRSSAQPSPSL